MTSSLAWNSLIEYPTGSGQKLALRDIAGDLRQLADQHLASRLGRPAARLRGAELLQTGLRLEDNLFFNEYFYGDSRS